MIALIQQYLLQETRRAAIRGEESVVERVNHNNLPTAVLNTASSVSTEVSAISDPAMEDDLLDENSRLREEKTCKVCMDAEVGVVFLPCGHLVVCPNCAPSLKVRNKCKDIVNTS